MKKRGMSLSIIFEAGSLNYGEGMGNVAELKKFNRGDGQVFTRLSSQTIRYEIRRLGGKLFNWNLNTVNKSKKVIQHNENVNIKDSKEMDLLGFMITGKGKNKKTKKTKKTKNRDTVVNVSQAFSLEPYKGDIDFLNNKGMADRIDEDPNIANIEQHQSFYAYTVSVELERVGKCDDGTIEISNEEKFERVKELLTIVRLLNKKIRGRLENLSPVFAIGGLYEVYQPYFTGRLQLNNDSQDFELETSLLKNALNIKILTSKVKESTLMGIDEKVFSNEEELKSLLDKGQTASVGDFFDKIENELKDHYLNQD